MITDRKGNRKLNMAENTEEKKKTIRLVSFLPG